MTGQFALVTDSTSDIPDDLVRQHQIYIAPLHILWGRDDFIDGVDITPAEFYERLARESQLPTSSIPSTPSMLTVKVFWGGIMGDELRGPGVPVLRIELLAK